MKHIILIAALCITMTTLSACTQAESKTHEVSTATEPTEPEFSGFETVETKAEPTDPQSNDDAGLETIEYNRLYSTRDEFHGVRCWYIMSQHDGSYAMSCLPNNQIQNADR